MESIYDFKVQDAKGTEIPLSQFRTKILLIVNTASQCGFTPQYEGLEKLYKEFRDQGFEILAFPCNQFGNQEPGSDEEIQNFCNLNYSVTFPIFRKIEVNGSNAHPLYKYLKKQAPGFLGLQDIKWNFTKFLIDPNGNVVRRYAPITTPEAIREDIQNLLKRNERST